MTCIITNPTPSAILVCTRPYIVLFIHRLCKEEIAALLSQYRMVDFDREYETQPGFREGFKMPHARRSELVAMLNQVILGVARHNNVVIEGRSGFAVLANYADVLHVRLQAPLAVRIERVAAQQQIPAEQAATVVKERDRVRTAFVENFYGVPWGATQAFDLVINTGAVFLPTYFNVGRTNCSPPAHRRWGARHESTTDRELWLPRGCLT